MPDYTTYDDSYPAYLDEGNYNEDIEVPGQYQFLQTIPQPLTTQIDPSLFAQPQGQDDMSNYVPYGPEQPGGSEIDKLIKALQPEKQNPYADAASVLGAYSQGEKSNRMATGQMAADYDRSMLAAQQGRNTTESDALKKLAQTKYLLGGGSHFDFNGMPYTYGGPPKPPSAAQQQGAQALQDQLIKRLSPGGTYTPIDFKKYGTPGKAEKVGNYGALAAGGLGVVNELMKAREGGSIAQNIPYGTIAKSIGGWFS